MPGRVEAPSPGATAAPDIAIHEPRLNAVFDAHWYHLFLEIDTCALGPTVISIPLRS